VIPAASLDLGRERDRVDLTGEIGETMDIRRPQEA